MKAKISTESPTPLMPHEELDAARLELSGLPKDTPLVVSVTYADRFDTVVYEVDPTPDGKLTYTFPKIGAGGVARIGHRVEETREFVGDDGKKHSATETVLKLIGSPIELDAEE